MRCPFCSEEDTQVKDSRPSDDGMSIRRRRHCLKCNSRFTTYERVQLRELMVVKKSGERKPFDRDKIFRSIELAVRKRSIKTEEVEIIVNKVVRELETSGDNEISSSVIGELIMNELAQLDQVAYVRFASVYKEFREARDFDDFIRKLCSGDI